MQACTADGTVYDITNIVPYVQKFKKHPVSGEPLQLRDIIQLHFHKNADNEYHDPILHKVCYAHPLNMQVVHVFIGHFQVELFCLSHSFVTVPRCLTLCMDQTSSYAFIVSCLFSLPQVCHNQSIASHLCKHK